MPTSLLDLMGYMQGQADTGTALRKQGRLAQLASQAYAAPRDQRGPLVQQAIATDPQSGFALDKSLQGGDDERMQRVGQMAGMLVSLPPQARAQAYPGIVQQLHSIGLGQGLPDQWSEDLLPYAQQLAQSVGGQQQPEGRVVGNAMVNPVTGQVMYQGESAPKPPTYVDVPDGRGGTIKMQWDAKSGGLVPLQMGGEVPFTVDPSLPPEVRASIISDPQAGSAAGITGPISGLGYTPPKAPAVKADYRTLSAAEVKMLGLPEGTVAQMSPQGQVQIVNKPRDLPGGGQVIENDDGTTTFVPTGRLSDSQRNAAGFYQRMVEANKELTALEASGYDPTNLRDYTTVGGKVLNGLASDNGQRYHQAAQNWVRANLRKESGAAIGVAEMDQEIRNYFPVFGDSKAVIQQKAHNRKIVEDAMRQTAGGALPPPPRRAPSGQASSPAGASDPLGIL